MHASMPDKSEFEVNKLNRKAVHHHFPPKAWALATQHLMFHSVCVILWYLFANADVVIVLIVRVICYFVIQGLCLMLLN